MRSLLSGVLALAAFAVISVVGGPTATADNSRLNKSVVANVYTIQHQAGCTSDIRINAALTLAAQWHAQDLLGNRGIDGDLGSDGSSPQSRSVAAGFGGVVAQLVAINQSLAINNLDVLNQWYNDPTDYQTMSNCANTAIGVWSENSLDRSVVVAVLGQPA